MYSISFLSDLGVDEVLRGQGADPQALRRRSPQAVAAAEAALERGLPLLQPYGVQKTLPVLSSLHGEILLEGDERIRAAGAGQVLAGSTNLLAVAVTIGPLLEEAVSECLRADAPLGLALDGLGNAAVDALVSSLCWQCEEHFSGQGLQTTPAISPGQAGWCLEEGQSLLFRRLQPDPAKLWLTSSSMMLPRKSASFVIGIGSHLNPAGSSCDFCGIQGSCRFRDSG